MQDKSFRIVDLPALAGARLAELPVVLRLLLENVVRCQRGAERDAAVQAILDWTERATSDAEIAFQPGRVLMHDTTSTPALVDIAAMRDVLAERGVDPSRLNPAVPVDVSVDHSLAVESYACADAPARNLEHELRRNAERYRFLRWASRTLRGVRIHAPGTGIMHTMNLEQLATVVTVEERDGEHWLVPDTMLGTDSHTPMVNGIGVLGWGVGGLEAQTVMFGMPTVLRVPDVVGVRLTGRLPPGVVATDLALTVTHRLRAIGVSGEFVEFFGPGVAALSAGDRAVVANMAPEYGATTGYFPVDGRTLDYLRETGRGDAALQRIERYLRRVGAWFDAGAAPRYTRTIEVDLGTIGMHVAGPRRPQDLLAYWQTGEALAKTGEALAKTGEALAKIDEALAKTDEALAKTDEAPAKTGEALAETGVVRAGGAAMPPYAVAIAAITSCTNTTDPRLLVAAGLVARNARRLGLAVPRWVKTSLAPGSPAAASYLERAGLIGDLAALGFDIVGYGCTTCIGNSGALTEPIRAAARAGTVHPVAVLSGNRNFAGRVHPDLDLGFIMSPALVVAFALAGDAARNLRDEPVGTSAAGAPVMLRELWPDDAEVDAHLAQALDRRDFRRAFEAAERNPRWHAIASPETARFPWNPHSTILRRPPFAAADGEALLGRYLAYPLLVVGDDVTTDHISPASAIPPDSMVADFLVERGEDRNDLNVFASRRGNWEVMLRAAFHSKSLVNRLRPGLPVAHTVHAPSGDVVPIWEAAERHREAGEAVVLVAGERYGTGSSRDWAAKGQRLLGVRAVLAASFERIHRSNLIGMGILPLRLPAGVHPDTLALRPGDRIDVDAPAAALAPRAAVPVRVLRADGTSRAIETIAAVETQFEVDFLKAGGVIPTILRRTIAGASEPATERVAG